MRLINNVRLITRVYGIAIAAISDIIYRIDIGIFMTDYCIANKKIR